MSPIEQLVTPKKLIERGFYSASRITRSAFDDLFTPIFAVSRVSAGPRMLN